MYHFFRFFITFLLFFIPPYVGIPCKEYRFFNPNISYKLLYAISILLLVFKDIKLFFIVFKVFKFNLLDLICFTKVFFIIFCFIISLLFIIYNITFFFRLLMIMDLLYFLLFLFLFLCYKMTYLSKLILLNINDY